jgi:EmrB/QacA subfamily drug resistance transporter
LSEPISATTEPAAPPRPAPQATPIKASNRHWILAATMATMFITAIEGTIIATAMPTIAARLGGFELFSWVFTSYFLTQAVTIPIYGRLADLYGRKRVLFVGIFFFLIGSVLCGLAWDMISLVGFRALQGIGAGGILPIAMTLVGDLYTPAERARIQGYLSGVWGSAAVIGPLLGAIIVAHFSWAFVFWINVPIGIVAVTMLAVTLREQIQHRKHHIDYLGSILLTIGTGVLMFSLVQAATLSLSTLLLLLLVAALAIAAFLVHEAKTPEPMLPLRLLRNRVIAGGNLANFAFGAVMMGITAFLPAYVQGVLGRSAFIAAVTLMPMTVSWSVGAMVTGRLVMRTSYRTTSAIGGCFLVCGSVALTTLSPASGPAWAGFGALSCGLGLGFISNSFVVAVQSSVDWSQRGVATSTILFTRMIGQAIGTALFGGILNASLGGRLAAGGPDVATRFMEPALRETLPAGDMELLTRLFAEALHNVYLINVALALVVFSTSLAMPAKWSPVRAAHKAA